MNRREPLAIVGIGCRYPGVESLRAFWEMLRAGADMVGDMPADRFDVDRLFSPTPAPGRMSTRRGGFLHNIEAFDAAAFGISPREADRLDPQQRLLLETGWEALDDAGCSRGTGEGARAGVFVGLWLNDYEGRLFRDREHIDFYMTLGTGRYSASGRLSYTFGFEGPSLTLDTACSSSLTAIHLACQSLRSGECDLALAGGANVILDPAITIAYSQSGMMAPDGRCKFGDARGDGYVRSEGAGLVVLKRLADAIAARDRIYAVIEGSAVNNDGRSSGFLATPGRRGQEVLLRRAYADAGISPARVQYVEAHGTGTRAGDPVEIVALGAVLGEGRAVDAPCRVGSVKTNLGHTEGAAGVAGLIKVALALDRGVVPASLHFETPNPDIDWTALGVRVQAEASAWPDTSEAPVAGVSSFGIAGTNAHVVLRQWRDAPASVPTVSTSGQPPRLLPISSHSPGALVELAKAWGVWLGEPETAAFTLDDICYTAAVRRPHHAFRAAFVGGSREEMQKQLEAYTPAENAAVARADQAPRKIVFVFPGQGAQWIGMGRELSAREPVFRAALERCDAAIRGIQGWSVLDALDAPSEASPLDRIDVVQPVLFSIQVALAALWTSWGLRPDAVVGHSMGEVAAAHVAGALSLDAAVRVIVRRSALLTRTSGRGAMAVVELSWDAARAAIEGYEDRVAVAVCNSRQSSVLSGDPAALQVIVDGLMARDVFCRFVKVDVASHSPQMDPLLDELRATLGALDPVAPAIPIYSTVVDGPGGPVVCDAAYWADNLRKPVRFVDAVEALLADGHLTFIEMSPHPLLVNAVQDAARAAGLDDVIAVGSTRRDEDESAVMLDAAATLYVRGHDLSWSDAAGADVAGDDGRLPRLISLPPYRWQRERFWYDDGPEKAESVPDAIPGRRVRSALQDGASLWSFALSTRTAPTIADHRVRGRVLVPATVFVEWAHTVAQEVLGCDRIVVLEQLDLKTALDLEAGSTTDVQITARSDADGGLTIEVFSGAGPAASREASSTWTRHATCRAVSGGAPHPAESPALIATDARIVEAGEHYANMAARGLEYGPAFRAVARIAHDGDHAQAELTPAIESPRIGAEIYDSALQVLLATAPAHVGLRVTYVPVSIRRVVLASAAAVAWPITADVVVETPPMAETGAFAGEVSIRDAGGALVAVFEGVRFARVGGPEAEPLLHHIAWPAEPVPAPAGDAHTGDWVVLADASGLGERLARRLASSGGRVRVVRAADALSLVDSAALTIRPEVRADYDALVASLEGLDLRGIVHVWSVDAALAAGKPEPAAAAPWAALHSQTVIGALWLAQACIASGMRPAAGLVFATAGASQTGEALGGGALAGFNAVLRSEHPELRSRVVDVGIDGGADDLEALAAELAAAPDADRVSIREGRRFVARLERGIDAATIEAPANEPAPFAPRRFRLAVRRPGVIEALEARPLPLRLPGPSDVEIEVVASGLNFMNVLSALGSYPGYPEGVGPLGIECAGHITAIGEDVRDLAVGDAVMAMAFDSLATHTIVDRALVVRQPANLDGEAAAGAPIVFLTAHYALNYLARIGRGERVLIHSAAGGVGQAAMQLARRAGATIFATAGTPERRAWLAEQGVAHVFDSRGAFAAAVMEATHGEGVDIVLNSLAGDAVAQGLAVLRAGGRFVEIGKRDIYENRSIGLLPFQRNLSYFAVDLDRMAREQPSRVGGMLQEVADLLASGAVKPIPPRRWPLAQAAEAFSEMARGQHAGKSVIVVRGERPAVATWAPADGTVLITGGLGALGTAMAEWLVARGVRHLALLGRREGGEHSDAVARLRHSGATVHTLRADVGDAAALEDALTGMRATLPPLVGVIHAAGALEDATILQLDAPRIKSMLDTKMAGAWNLHQLTAGDPLQFFVMTGSVASFAGLAGQANYAAANAFLEDFAAYRRRGGRPALTIAFGPWSDRGLAAQAHRGGRLASMGLGSLTGDEGLDALARLLASGAANASVMRFDARRWRASNPSPLPVLERLDAKDDTSTGSAGGSGLTPNAKASLRETLESLSPGRARRTAIEQWAREQLAQVLRLSSSRIDVTKPFRPMGLDSLMGLELRRRLEIGAGLGLPVTIVWNFPTVAQLAGELARRMGIDLEGAATPPVAASAEGGASVLEQLMSELEQLSDEEAARLVEEDR